MYRNYWRTVLISGVVTLMQSIVVAALISATLAGVSLAAAWFRNDIVFHVALVVILMPQRVAAHLIFLSIFYKRVYILDAIGLLLVPLFIPYTVFRISQFALKTLLDLQLSSEACAIFVVGGYAYLLLGLVDPLQAFMAYVERPYFGIRKRTSCKGRRW